jgi:hypothetical protein
MDKKQYPPKDNYILFEIVGHHYPLADIVFGPCRILLYFGENCFALVQYQIIISYKAKQTISPKDNDIL